MIGRGEREHAICQCCGRPFTRRVADRKRGWAKCCSKSCAARLRFKGGQAKAAPAPKAGAGRIEDIEVCAGLRTTGPEFQFTWGMT